mmetsp:Transcript_5847/g.16870  ORF Transcript_5847/g.16870 Transcript_5847/m.16870 type:complete len:1154 (-) Transcript_5847:347-3808(-)
MVPQPSSDGAAASGAPTQSIAARAYTDDERSAVSSVTHGSKSTSTSALVSLVKEQVSLVRNLTSANKNASEELQKVQEEKQRIEAEYRKMQEQMAAADSTGSGQEAAAMATATPLGTINEDMGAEISANGWVNFENSQAPPPLPPAPLVGADGFPVHGSHEAPFQDEFRASANVEVYNNGLGPRATVAPGMVGAPPPYGAPGSMPPQDPGLGGIRQMDEWSTVGYPSARNVAVAEPIGDIETQMQAEKRAARKKKKKKAAAAAAAAAAASMPPKKTIPLVSTDPAPELKIPEKEVTCGSRFWASFSRLLTFFIPDMFICRDGAPAKQAWREKVAIFVIMLLTSAITVGLFGFFPLFFCQEKEQYTWEDIRNQNNGVLSRHREAWTVIHGKIYDVKDFVDRHPGGASSVLGFLGLDASKLFPRTPPGDLDMNCLNENAAPALVNLTKATCNMLSEDDKFLFGAECHDFATGPTGVEKYMGKYRRGTLVYAEGSLFAEEFDWIVIRGTVYNITSYIDQIGGKLDSPLAFLEEQLSRIIVTQRKTDATDIFNRLYSEEAARNYQMCLDHLFYQGDIDTRGDPTCNTFNMIMYVLLILVAGILVLQCLCSLFYVARKSRTLTADMVKQHILVMIPCYNEGDKELRKTIKSVLDTEYPDDNKVMLICCDGLITGRGEACSTPETIAKMLGYTMDMKRDTAHYYKSIGANTRNRAFVYHGIYKKDGRELKYCIVVKCGTSKERSTPRAGNRGKRDSQLLLLGLFNRVHYGRELCDLDIAICRALNDLEVSIEDLKYMMAIDADTRVHKDSMAQMIFSMEQKETILACCGETRVDNKAQSWVTIIQVYEYFSSHHMKKAFESLFGTVTCLPGCFTMYRIRANDNRPLLACDYVFGEYSRNDIDSLHEKNLYLLGEDRMLTTLLLQFFSDMNLAFVPEAICWTIVPHTFKILLSQRRRWINSTFHNMWELLKVKTMCGVCVFSMKTIVIADMISTMILPASLTYAVYFLAVVIVGREPLSQTIVLVYTIIFGSQMIIFILRSRWSYFFWFIAFQILGVPVFYFILPLYSFWHMDDLSWGQTRQVEGGDKSDDTEDGEVEVSGTTETPFCDEDGTLPADLSAPAPPATPQPPGHKGSSATALVHVHTEDGTGRVGTVGLTEV